MKTTLDLSDTRQQDLAAAWDEETAPYRVGKSLTVRPFSLNALRRAEAMNLALVRLGYEAARQRLPDRKLLTETDRLAWLLCAPLAEVKSAFRHNRVESETQPYSIDPGDLAPFTAEMKRVLELLRSTIFLTQPKLEDPGDSTPGESPPASLIAPGIFGGLLLSVAEKVGENPATIAEHWPACQVMQYLHCVQWGNSSVWTVDSDQPSAEEADPWEGGSPDPDEGFGEDIEF